MSAALILVFNGRVAGISGIAGGALAPQKEDMAWRLAFLLGLIGTGAALGLLAPSVFGGGLARSSWAWIAGGLLVGFGTRLGNGCTSGHGICGLSRFSARSLVAVLTFMLSAGGMTFVVNHLLGGNI